MREQAAAADHGHARDAASSDEDVAAHEAAPRLCGAFSEPFAAPQAVYFPCGGIATTAAAPPRLPWLGGPGDDAAGRRPPSAGGGAQWFRTRPRVGGHNAEL